MTLQLQFRLFCSKLSFRALCDFDLNEAIDANMMITYIFYCRVYKRRQRPPLRCTTLCSLMAGGRRLQEKS